MKNQTTNIEVVTRLMEFSRHGVAAQLFIMDALSKHAQHVAEMPAAEVEQAFTDNPIVSGTTWQAVAREIHEELKKHFANAPAGTRAN